MPDAEKGKGKFSALKKEDSTPEKEPTKEDIVKNEPIEEKVEEGETEEKKSNGAHSPK